MPTVIVAAVVIVASVFMSSKAAPPIAAEVVAEQPPPLPAPTHAAVTLNSEPAGAEVTRLTDGRLLGTTPVVDIRPVSGQSINYRFRESGRSLSSSSHKTPRGKGKKAEEPAQAMPATVAAPAAPAAQPHYDTTTTTLPQLNPSVRVRRIGGR